MISRLPNAQRVPITLGYDLVISLTSLHLIQVRIHITGATFALFTGCITVYFNSEEKWLQTLKLEHVLTLSGLFILFLILAYANTTNSNYYRLYFSNTPDNIKGIKIIEYTSKEFGINILFKYVL